MKANLCGFYFVVVILSDFFVHEGLAMFRSPIIVKGPKVSKYVNLDLLYSNEYGSNEVGKKSRVLIDNIDINSQIQNRFDSTSVNCFVTNPSFNKEQEVLFTLQLPYYTYKIVHASLQTLSDEAVYTGETDTNAKTLYQTITRRGHSAVLITEFHDNARKSYPEAVLLLVRLNVQAGEKILLKLQYEGTIVSTSNGTWTHIVDVVPQEFVQNFNYNAYIRANLPIIDVKPMEVRNHQPTLKYVDTRLQYDTPEYLHVSFTPKKSQKAQDGYDMSGQFLIAYHPSNNYLLNMFSKVGQNIKDVTIEAEYEKIDEENSTGLGSIFSLLLVIPQAIASAVRMVFSAMMEFDKQYYIDNPAIQKQQIKKDERRRRIFYRS